jgi:aspartyl-tRNA(Asn)/glutamyl-tRNA(Gln) amidotransferase subunit B
MLGEMIALIDQGTISGKMAKTVFIEMWKTQKDPVTIVKEKGLVQITDTSAIEKIIDEILMNHPNETAEFRAGKIKLMGFFVGAAMKATKGQANPDIVNQILSAKLKG